MGHVGGTSRKDLRHLRVWQVQGTSQKDLRHFGTCNIQGQLIRDHHSASVFHFSTSATTLILTPTGVDSHPPWLVLRK